MPLDPPSNPHLDYSKSRHSYVVAHFILECSRKLELDVLSTGTAAMLFHSFQRKSFNSEAYDPYLIAGACLCLSGKESTAKVTLRDVVNVVYATVHTGENEDTPEQGSEYFAHKDAFVEAEMLLLRVVDFRIKFPHPHQYLLQYLKTLKEWLSPQTWNNIPIATSAWKFIQDFYHDPFLLDSQGPPVALAVIHLTLKIYSVEVDYFKKEEDWMRILYGKADMREIDEITSQILKVYEDEDKLLSPLVIKDKV
uniref:Cyclin-related protein FAM58A n=1 Tax=Caligus clemensi TaxID=344056 RepID=C1C3A5_CALCM|nr:Cyclin-related protein FAM58A [Caligus clemensi]